MKTQQTKPKLMNPPRPLRRQLFFCTPCDMETEHYAAEGYWNCHACGNSITLDNNPDSSRQSATPAQAHSPLPWTEQNGAIYDATDNGHEAGFRLSKLVVSSTAITPANAAFIVRACNNAQRLADVAQSVMDEASDGIDRSAWRLRAAREALAQWEGSKQ